MHFFLIVVEFFFKSIMHFQMWMFGERVHYLIAPDEIISRVTVERIMKIFHLLPSLILAGSLVFNVLPENWLWYENYMYDDPIRIILAFIGMFTLISFLNGVIIEKIVTLTYKEYANYKNNLKHLKGRY